MSVFVVVVVLEGHIIIPDCEHAYLCSAKRHRIFQDCEQNCPLYLEETSLCVPELFAIEISLKREFRAKDSQCLTHNVCKNTRDLWRIVFQQPHALN